MTNLALLPLETDLQTLINMGFKQGLDLDAGNILINIRHIFLDVAKDLARPDRAWGDKEVGLAYCEAAERIHEALEVIGYESDDFGPSHPEPFAG